MSPTGEGSISCGYRIYMYEGGIVGKKGGLRIEHLSRYNCSSNLDKLQANKINQKEFNTTNQNFLKKAKISVHNNQVNSINLVKTT
jgi:hypothetical protein